MHLGPASTALRVETISLRYVSPLYDHRATRNALLGPHPLAPPLALAIWAGILLSSTPLDIGFRRSIPLALQ